MSIPALLLKDAADHHMTLEPFSVTLDGGIYNGVKIVSTSPLAASSLVERHWKTCHTEDIRLFIGPNKNDEWAENGPAEHKAPITSEFESLEFDKRTIIYALPNLRVGNMIAFVDSRIRRYRTSDEQHQIREQIQEINDVAPIEFTFATAHGYSVEVCRSVTAKDAERMANLARKLAMLLGMESRPPNLEKSIETSRYLWIGTIADEGD